MANVENSSEIAMQHGPMYAPEHQPQYYLFTASNLNYVLLKQIGCYSVPHSLVVHYLMMWMRPKRTVADAITHEFKSDWFKGWMNRHKATDVLADLVQWNILAKVSPSHKCRRYYVNPLMYNLLTISQRSEFFQSYRSLFGPIELPAESLAQMPAEQ